MERIAASYQFVGPDELMGGAQIFRRYNEIPEQDWERFFGAQWKNQAFLRIVEETLSDDFEYFYIVLRDTAGNALALQPGFLTRQDLALGFPEMVRRAVARTRRIFTNFLSPKMAFLGSPAANGKLGNADSAAAVAEAFIAHARREKIGLLTFKEFPAEDRPAFFEVKKRGFSPLASYPGVVLDLDFPDFESYLAAKVGKSTRKALRRKFRSLEDLPPIRMECVADISPHLTRIQELYLEVFERSAEKFEKLTPGFFAKIAEKLPDRARFFLWWQADKVVAFSLCFVHDGAFYDDYLGMDGALSHDLHLYYVTFRDQMNWALAHGLRAYYSTPMSYEPKLRLGFRLVPLDLYVRHTSPFLNWIYRPLARAFAPTLTDPILQQFPNFSDLDPR